MLQDGVSVPCVVEMDMWFLEMEQKRHAMLAVGRKDLNAVIATKAIANVTHVTEQGNKDILDNNNFRGLSK